MSSAVCFNLDQSKIVLFGNWLTLLLIILRINDPGKAFEIIVGKGENAGDHCLSSEPYCLPSEPYCLPSEPYLLVCLAFFLISAALKLGCLVKTF